MFTPQIRPLLQGICSIRAFAVLKKRMLMMMYLKVDTFIRSERLGVDGVLAS
jgi:hypothetical protein